MMPQPMSFASFMLCTKLMQCMRTTDNRASCNAPHPLSPRLSLSAHKADVGTTQGRALDIWACIHIFDWRPTPPGSKSLVSSADGHLEGHISGITCRLWSAFAGWGGETVEPQPQFRSEEGLGIRPRPRFNATPHPAALLTQLRRAGLT